MTIIPTESRLHMSNFLSSNDPRFSSWLTYFDKHASTSPDVSLFQSSFNMTNQISLKDPAYTSQSDYTIPDTNITYSGVSNFYRPSSTSSSISSASHRLIVFIHGLGGTKHQFERLLNSPALLPLANEQPSSILAIDLPGCGDSERSPHDWPAYRLSNLASLVNVIIARFYSPEEHSRGIVLVGHSLGCSIAALALTAAEPNGLGDDDHRHHPASRKPSPLTITNQHCKGFITLCPRTTPLSPHQIRQLSWLPYLPVTVFNIFRLCDRIGGLDSASITRYVGHAADQETRELQRMFNAGSRSEVVLRMLAGLAHASAPAPVPARDGNGSESGSQSNQGRDDSESPSGMAGGQRRQQNHRSAPSPPQNSLLGKRVWTRIPRRCKILCVVGGADQICPPANAELLARWLSADESASVEHVRETAEQLERDKRAKDQKTLFEIGDQNASQQLHKPWTEEQRKSQDDLPLDAGEVPPILPEGIQDTEEDNAVSGSTTANGITAPKTSLKADVRSVSQHLKIVTFPAPAAHGLLYDSRTVDVLGSHIGIFPRDLE